MANTLYCAASAWLLLCSTVTAAAAEDTARENDTPPNRVPAAVAQLEKLANESMQRTSVPGIAIAVVHRDQVVYQQGFGVCEVGQPDRIDADTVFQVASMSKPIASTVLASLVGEGRINWDDRVIDHDPEFRMFDPYVTRELRLRDLLCHRSGLPDHAGDLLEDLGYDRQDILYRLRYLPPASSFRTKFAYTNFGYSEAGFAAAKAAGVSWEDLAAKQLFAPLGMKSTSYRFADYEQASNRARLHVLVDGKWTAKNTRQPDAQAPAGGASSTLKDLSRWLLLQVNAGKFEGRQVVAASALADTHTPQIVTSFSPEQGRVGSYGLGWIVSVERDGRAFYKHSGAFSLGMRTEAALLPSEEIGIVVLSNAGSTGVPEGVVESFFDLVVYGELKRDWIEFADRMAAEDARQEFADERDYSQPPKEPKPALAPSAYTGKYTNDFFGTIELAETNGALVLKMGPKLIAFPLDHWDRDTFTYQPIGEMAGGRSGVCFSVAPDGRADRVLIESLNVCGQGAFTRVE